MDQLCNMEAKLRAWLPYDPESDGEWKLLFEHVAYKHSLTSSSKNEKNNIGRYNLAHVR